MGPRKRQRLMIPETSSGARNEQQWGHERGNDFWPETRKSKYCTPYSATFVSRLFMFHGVPQNMTRTYQNHYVVFLVRSQMQACKWLCVCGILCCLIQLKLKARSPPQSDPPPAGPSIFVALYIYIYYITPPAPTPPCRPQTMVNIMACPFR